MNRQDRNYYTSSNPWHPRYTTNPGLTDPNDQIQLLSHLDNAPLIPPPYFSTHAMMNPDPASSWLWSSNNVQNPAPPIGLVEMRMRPLPHEFPIYRVTTIGVYDDEPNLNLEDLGHPTINVSSTGTFMHAQNEYPTWTAQSSHQISGYKTVQTFLNQKALHSENRVFKYRFNLNLSPRIIFDFWRFPDAKILLRLESTGHPETQSLQTVKVIIQDRILRSPPSRKSLTLSWNITNFLSFARQNEIKISAKVRDFLPESKVHLFIGVVQRLSIREMLGQLESKPRISVESAKEQIRRVLRESADTAVRNLIVQMICPYSKMLIRTPVRGIYCNHIACFDALSFLFVYRTFANWRCPICRIQLDFEDLRIDNFFENILSSVAAGPLVVAGNQEVAIDAEGRFELVRPSSELIWFHQQQPSSSLNYSLGG